MSLQEGVRHSPSTTALITSHLCGVNSTHMSLIEHC